MIHNLRLACVFIGALTGIFFVWLVGFAFNRIAAVLHKIVEFMVNVSINLLDDCTAMTHWLETYMINNKR